MCKCKPSLLDLYDPLFSLSYLLPPPYNTAQEVADKIDEVIGALQVKNLKQQMAADVLSVFMNINEFAELCSYTTPAGVSTLMVPVVVNKASFITEYENTAGLGGTIVLPRAVIDKVEIHGNITLTSGEVFKILQIIAIDNDTTTVSALADERISPRGMRQ